MAFFSAIDVDKCLRKEPDLEFVSPSNPNGLTKGYQIPKGNFELFKIKIYNVKIIFLILIGVCMDIYTIIEKTNGKLTKE